MKKKDKKPQKETIKFWQEEYDRTEKARQDIQNLPPDVQSLFDKAYKAKADYLKSIEKELDKQYEYMCLCRNKVQELKNQKKLSIPIEVEKWFREYKSGVDFGYHAPKIIHVSEDKQFVIIRHTGGTAGTGTAMGTGGYYYAKTEHWIAKVGGANYISWTTAPQNKACEFYGRLGKKEKELMLQYIDECISGERDFYKDNGYLTSIYPEAFTEEERLKKDDWR